MADLSKHRLEKDTYEVDFSSALATGESLSGGTATVTVTRTPGAWTNVSSQFGSPTGTVSGDTVQFTLSAAGADEQAADTYFVRVEADTDGSHHLVATPTLEVTATADPDAP